MTACVPSKGLVQAARLLWQIRGAGEFGIHVEPPRVDLARVLSRLRRVSERLPRIVRTRLSRPAESMSSTARPPSKPTTRCCWTATSVSRDSGS